MDQLLVFIFNILTATNHPIFTCQTSSGITFNWIKSASQEGDNIDWDIVF